MKKLSEYFCRTVQHPTNEIMILCNGPLECPDCALRFVQDNFSPKKHECSVCHEMHEVKNG